jgi:hypothetical protein
VFTYEKERERERERERQRETERDRQTERERERERERIPLIQNAKYEAAGGHVDTVLILDSLPVILLLCVCVFWAGEVLKSVTTFKEKTDPMPILDADLWVVGLLYLKMDFKLV